MEKTYYKITLTKEDLENGIATKENLETVVKKLGDNSWRTAEQGFDDYTHSISTMADITNIDGGHTVGFLFVSPEMKQNYNFAVYTANRTNDEVIDLTDRNVELADKLVSEGLLTEISFSELLVA